MQRRTFCLMLMSTTASATFGSPVQANSLSERVERSLKRDGWRDIDITRTLLGRTRVTARKGDARREIILNTRSGEVLRDVLVRDQGGVSSVFDDDDDKGRGRGRGGDDDDDRDDDDGDDGDDNDGDDGGDDGGGDHDD